MAKFTALLVTLLGILGACNGVVRLPKIFGDDMVFQRRPFIYGMADAGERIGVEVSNPRSHLPLSYVVYADQLGKWRTRLDSIRLYPPSEIVVSGNSGPSVTLHNVSGGYVLLCSGQSNMGVAVNYISNATATIAEADHYSNIRLFQVEKDTSPVPKDDLNGTWVINSATTVRTFSAVCYLTGLWMSRFHWHNGPIGLIQSDWGGTTIQEWMSGEALKQCGEYNEHYLSHGLGDNLLAPDRGAIKERGLFLQHSIFHTDRVGPIAPPRTPSVLYNAMIHPLAGLAIDAGLWYQGEANVNESREAYACNLASMIQSWRDVWGIGDFSWLNVQLAPYTSRYFNISDVRLAQTDVRPHPNGSIDTVGTAIIIDLGDDNGTVHPHNKTEVGRRLALQFLHVNLAKQYPNVTFSGPEFKSASVASDGNVVVTFDYADRMYFGDTHGCEENEGCCGKYYAFEVSDDNMTWYGVISSINMDTVILHILSGKKPRYIRLDISNFPGCALYNSAQLPAAPFIHKVSTIHGNRGGVESERFPDLHTSQGITTPPAGFNSWNFYHCNIDERILMRTADAFVSKGLKDAGYQFINIDDCWQVDRTPDGTIVPDPVRFPSGMKALADYIHSKGLKFGLYTAQREFTCQKRPGSFGHELHDAATYCEWGVDYVKIDRCSGEFHLNINESWILFKQGFDKCKQQTGREIVMSVESCQEVDGCGTYIAGLANLWRTSNDIRANWDSVMNNLDENNVMASVAEVGHYNDPDMLEVGNPGLSLTEAKAHFALWNIVMAPLLIGTDVLTMTDEVVEILTAEEVLNINRDILGKQGKRVSLPNATGSEVWARPLSGHVVVVGLLNRGVAMTNITVTWDMIFLPPESRASVRDLWQKKDLGFATDQFGATVQPHEVVLVLITPT